LQINYNDSYPFLKKEQMKLQNIILGIFVVVLSINSASAQKNILNSVVAEDIGQKTNDQLKYDNDMPLPYGFIDERDILWSKATWEIIDLDQRVNFPLYFPVEKASIGTDRISLFEVLLTNIKNGNITDIYSKSYFTEKITYSDIESRLVFEDFTFYDKQVKIGIDDPDNIDRYTLTPKDIEKWKIRGLWYIDKRLGELRYRIIGICPVAISAQGKLDDTFKDEVELFWIYYPSIRNILHEAKAFNKKNTSRPISFDHILNSRRFSGVIYREENVYGNRDIGGKKGYMSENAFMQLLESDRIKEKIRNIELDLWNY
jgi:gliding motility associated protien GldN